jgi:cytochrome c peroxidase
VTEEVTPPLALRRALLAFLARFSHAENPLAVRRPSPRRFTDYERRGAELFRAHCVRCHAARLVARDAAKEVPFERWEALVLSPEGPIVWSNGDYAKTGVLPYVDPKGTQTPSLRRLYLKRPYLTNGSARTLDELLAGVGWSDSGFAHAPAPGPTTKLDADERRVLRAFLEVL